MRTFVKGFLVPILYLSLTSCYTLYPPGGREQYIQDAINSESNYTRSAYSNPIKGNAYCSIEASSDVLRVFQKKNIFINQRLKTVSDFDRYVGKNDGNRLFDPIVNREFKLGVEQWVSANGYKIVDGVVNRDRNTIVIEFAIIEDINQRMDGLEGSNFVTATVAIYDVEAMELSDTSTYAGAIRGGGVIIITEESFKRNIHGIASIFIDMIKEGPWKGYKYL